MGVRGKEGDGKMKYVIRKAGAFAATLLIVSFLVFAAFDIIPGDAAISKLGTEATPEKVEALREEMGLNRPFLIRYGDWASGFVRGDMGTSYSYDRPVAGLILSKLPITLTMSGLAFVITVLLAIVLGLFTAGREGSAADRVLTAAGQTIMSIPPFFLGILLTFVFGLLLKLFTPGGYVSYETDPIGFIKYLFFPALAIALPKSAMAMKLFRSAIARERELDYTRTAYSRGNSTKMVLYRHILKNAMLPLVTFLGMSLSDMVAGSIIVEQVFSIPGLGRILLTSISGRDYPVVMAIIFWIAVLVLSINLIVDLVYRLIDPRIAAE